MSLASDEKLVLATADKLIVVAQQQTKNEPFVAIAALGVALMSLALANDTTREELNELLDIAERGMVDA